MFEVAGIVADRQTGAAIAEDLIRSGEAIARLDACRDVSRQLSLA